MGFLLFSAQFVERRFAAPRKQWFEPQKEAKTTEALWILACEVVLVVIYFSSVHTAFKREGAVEPSCVV